MTTSPTISSPKANSFSDTCAKISFISGIVAIPAVAIFAVFAFVSALMYQSGEGSIGLAILIGILGIIVHGAAVVAAIVALTNNAPKGKAWTGIILNGLAALAILIIIFLTSFA
jgi:hypothetical protein